MIKLKSGQPVAIYKDGQTYIKSSYFGRIRKKAIRKFSCNKFVILDNMDWSKFCCVNM